ncbi:L domain-like protein [Coemansia reversa NRRL 1564]|uniref:L domain-like protein n=1 Tax=Coemansia reversa (strain ATCC 12441 / NRRL 1564) TaxID=763665 RepID=A0A2G5BG33_COERN|nr:L domain-like protein [Coemansia reversa NRRL 1564]|eukprot:PIA17961.1 L domain-like protein [Coemansia reversa NRRL 1564]
MQADSRVEKDELQRVMWSPYPEHHLTLWAMPSPPVAAATDPSHTDTRREHRARLRRLQYWQISRNFNPGSGARGRTTEILASHRLNFGNQSITCLSIPSSSVSHLESLVELRMPQNRLSSLPRALFMLPGLEILNLENNRLDEHAMHDAWWPGLSRLRVLFLAGNCFAQLPPSLGRMPRLFYLDVSDNSRLTCLPAELLLSSSIATLAADRCSTALARRLELSSTDNLPFTNVVPDAPPYVPVPPLAALCVRALYLSAALARDQLPSETAARIGDLSICRRLLAACEEVRRVPDTYRMLSLPLKPLDAADDCAICTICECPLFYSSFAFVRAEPVCELPVAWRCCSARCRDRALQMVLTPRMPSGPAG